jgi:hypothetical protein
MRRRGCICDRLQVEKRFVEMLDVEAFRAIVNFKPPVAVTVNKHDTDGPRKGQKNFAWSRIHALACSLLDIGCRAQELLDARVQDFDMDDLLATVVGKGEKQRRIPFSVDLRRILFRYLQQRERFGVPAREPFMFRAHAGGPWDQRNALRSFYDLQKKLRLPRVGFHRISPARGDVVRLSRTLPELRCHSESRHPKRPWVSPFTSQPFGVARRYRLACSDPVVQFTDAGFSGRRAVT